MDGYIKCIISPRANRKTINIAYGKATSVTDFAELVKRYFPDFNYEITKSPLGEVNRGGLDITKAIKIINFKPKYSIEKGLKKTLALMKKYGWDSRSKV